jgi:chemotaxis protein MotB
MKKRISPQYIDKEKSIPSWQTIYCSMFLIMLVLFAMFVSYSVGDKRKMIDLRDTVRGYRGSTVGTQEEKASSGSIRVNTVNNGLWVNDALRTLSKAGIISGLGKDITVEMIQGGLRFNFKNDVLFLAGSAVVNDKTYPYFNEIIRIAKGKNLFLRVEGHTDDVPIRSGKFSSNWELSTMRAVNVLRYFIGKGEFPTERTAAAGFAQYHPLASNSTPEGRVKNRRIEIFLQP